MIIKKATRDFILSLSPPMQSLAIELLVDPKPGPAESIALAEKYCCGLLYVGYVSSGILKAQKGKAEIPDKYKEDIKAILDLFAELTHVHYRQDGKAAEMIRNRLHDGYSRQQLMAMMQYKHEGWRDTDFAKYMRPDTVMRASNCQRYMNEFAIVLSKSKPGEQRINNIAGAVRRAKEGV